MRRWFNRVVATAAATALALVAAAAADTFVLRRSLGLSGVLPSGVANLAACAIGAVTGGGCTASAGQYVYDADRSVMCTDGATANCWVGADPATQMPTMLDPTKITPGHTILGVTGGSGPALYVFTSHTFGTCGATGAAGPSESACRSAYSTGWDQDPSYFTVASGVQQWKVPETGTYRIAAVGASGATGRGGSNSGGAGAQMRGDFVLNQGVVLQIVVGQRGVAGASSTAGGGGGGTFVYRLDALSQPLIAAGGGAGGNACSGGSGQAATTNTTGVSANDGAGGASGNPGAIGSANNHAGGPGAGWVASAPHRTGTFGNPSSSTHGGDGGDSRVDNWAGGAGGSGGGPGGYGGGGGGSTCSGTGGGGGGFSGGGSAGVEPNSSGGGGSYNGGTNTSNGPVSNGGEGSVTIQKL